MKLVLLLYLLIGISVYGSDLNILEPKNGETVRKYLTLKIKPVSNEGVVNVWIENSLKRIVWADKLTEKNDYTLKENMELFPQGMYKIKVEYLIGARILYQERVFHLNP